MNQITLFDTSLGTRNLGDYVIKNAIDHEMSYLLQGNVVLRLPTHTPIARSYQVELGDIKTVIGASKYKFLCGTNLFKYTLLRPNRDWNIGLIDSRLYKDAIALGCGVEINARKPSRITGLIYKSILSRTYIHSVRDDRTKNYLNSLGFEAINTGCPTTWSITQDAVERAWSRRSENVLFTLTDYAADPVNDLNLFKILLKKYREIWLWLQGSRDFEYAKRLGILDHVHIIGPNFESFSTFQSKEFEYVGTRLHGGIFSLAHGHRTLITAVDHRALDMGECTGLPVVSRDNEEEIIKNLESDRAPEVKIPTENVKVWKKQFINNSR